MLSLAPLSDSTSRFDLKKGLATVHQSANDVGGDTYLILVSSKASKSHASALFWPACRSAVAVAFSLPPLQRRRWAACLVHAHCLFHLIRIASYEILCRVRDGLHMRGLEPLGVGHMLHHAKISRAGLLLLRSATHTMAHAMRVRAHQNALPWAGWNSR